MKETDLTLSLFFEIGREIRARMSTVCPIPMNQSELLSFVHGKGDVLMRDIARHFKITAPSATALVDELVDAGYLRRTQSESDRRQVRVSLGAKGVRFLVSMTNRKKAIVRRLLSPIPERDRRELNRILTTVRNGL